MTGENLVDVHLFISFQIWRRKVTGSGEKAWKLEAGRLKDKGMRFADRGWRIEDKRIKVKAVENSVSSEW